MACAFNRQSPVDRRVPAPYHGAMDPHAPDSLRRLFDLIRTLRAPGGCPWDREQRFDDVLSDLVEEAYEVQWAASQGRDDEIQDEMGDVLFLVCFALVIRQESDPDFTLDVLARQAYDKIYRRHPHIFGDQSAETTQESVAHWERIKAAERRMLAGDAGAMHGIAGNLPALRRAEKIQERASATGFDWNNVTGVIAKIREEIGELEEAVAREKRTAIASELGDVLFSAVNAGRFLKIDVEGALNETNARFTRRFRAMERCIEEDGKKMSSLSLEDMDEYWKQIKRDDS